MDVVYRLGNTLIVIGTLIRGTYYWNRGYDEIDNYLVPNIMARRRTADFT